MGKKGGRHPQASMGGRGEFFTGASFFVPSQVAGVLSTQEMEAWGPEHQEHTGMSA
jgi:hypothetical protein